MDISKLSTNEILEELNKRSVNSSNDQVLVFGTICVVEGNNFVEMFKEIKTEKDLDCLHRISLRARFNSHRNYLGFYFKTNQFKELKVNLNKDNKAFADWVKSTKNIKYIQL
jgi:hypothetical protein